MTLAAICGSDLHLYHGMMPDTRVGMTFGHEFIGVVHEVGPSVQNLNPGDHHSAVQYLLRLGFFCVHGLYSNCHNVNPNATAVSHYGRSRSPRCSTAPTSGWTSTGSARICAAMSALTGSEMEDPRTVRSGDRYDQRRGRRSRSPTTRKRNAACAHLTV